MKPEEKIRLSHEIRKAKELIKMAKYIKPGDKKPEWLLVPKYSTDFLFIDIANTLESIVKILDQALEGR